jgi:DNA-binding response OmpR family regulator
LEILSIEDNKGAVGLIEKFFKDTKIRISLHVAKDEEAVRFLCCENNFLGSLRPDIIILDLNLPKKDGREVLREIKENSDLKNIPAIILTPSSAEKDILRAYNLHANAYIVKPIDFNELMKVIGSIEEFWF